MSTLSFTIIQTQLHWEDKAANLDMLSQKIKNIEEYTEIIVPVSYTHLTLPTNREV